MFYTLLIFALLAIFLFLGGAQISLKHLKTGGTMMFFGAVFFFTCITIALRVA